MYRLFYLMREWIMAGIDRLALNQRRFDTH